MTKKIKKPISNIQEIQNSVKTLLANIRFASVDYPLQSIATVSYTHLAADVVGSAEKKEVVYATLDGSGTNKSAYVVNVLEGNARCV